VERREIVVAGHLVNAPMDVVVEYAAQFGETLARYDFGDRGLPDVLTAEEIWSTRIIRSRVTYAERNELARVAAECASLWAAIPFDANIRDADPLVTGGLYAKMLELYTCFTKVPGVSTAKASKILHFKRPSLYPILDSRLAELYEESATQAAEEYPQLGYRKMYWAAIRNDLFTNELPLRALRAELSSVQSPFRLSELTDMRILDILSWSR
jgi:hypothetical protein